MRKVFIICFSTFCLLCFFCGCFNIKTNNARLIGYWMDDCANTLSFSDEQTCSINNEKYQYKIYDNNHLQIISNNKTEEFVFKFQNSKLLIRSTNSETYTVFTKNENEQKEIIVSVSQAREQELQEQIKQNKISELTIEISKYEKRIEDANLRIENNKKDIELWEQDSIDRIKACEDAINFGDDKEYHENSRDEFIAVNKESIKNAEERIQQLELEILSYQNEIQKLRQEIMKINDVDSIE